MTAAKYRAVSLSVLAYPGLSVLPLADQILEFHFIIRQYVFVDRMDFFQRELIHSLLELFHTQRSDFLGFQFVILETLLDPVCFFSCVT
jgi:hypothetical protein